MKPVSKHIADLLYQHDCVIVPGLGGFIANYVPAKINSGQHFLPPSKHIVFNQNLKNNDGLLANKLVADELISYNEAVLLIDKYVAGINVLLKRGEKVKLDVVGTLQLNAERKVQFVFSGNKFSLDAFGLSEFILPALKQEPISKRMEKSLKKEGAKVVDLNSARPKIKYVRVMAMAAFFALIAGLFWVSFKSDVFKNINYASLNPFNTRAVVKDTLEVRTVAAEKSTETATVSVAENAENLQRELPENEKESNYTTDEKDSKVMPLSVVAEATPVLELSGRYHVVTGCFQIEENAANYVESLNSENIASAVVGKNEKGLYIVSSGSYDSYVEAVRALRAVQKTKPNAWIYNSGKKIK